MKSFISLEEALSILNSSITKNEVEQVHILNSINKVVAENIYATINNPPFDKSAMDGYAINVSNEQNKGDIFKVVGEVFAGTSFEKHLNNGESIKIMTGAPIPKGANAVIKKEDVIYKDGYITLLKDIYENENVCFEGEDIKKGGVLVKSGKKICYSDIGILASSGISNVPVYKKAKVAFLTTGDEVVDIDEDLRASKIYNSNKYSIIARLLELGYSCEFIEHSNDDYEKIGQMIKSLSDKVDLIITTGGVSVGDKDLLKNAINHINGESLFWKVKIKPGSAMLFSKYKDTHIISLSGNPTAALTTFELLVKPALEKYAGDDNIKIERESAILLNNFNKKSIKRRFLRGKAFIKDEKQYVDITQTKSGNGILSSTLESNCLIEIKESTDKLEAGEIVTIIKL